MLSNDPESALKIIRSVVFEAKDAKWFADERTATQLYMLGISVTDLVIHTKLF